MVGSAAACRRPDPAGLGGIESGRTWIGARKIGRAPKAAKRILDDLSRRTDRFSRLLGHAKLNHSGFHPLCTFTEIADARPGDWTAANHDGLRVYWRCGHECDAGHLRHGNSESSGPHEPI